jgi:hypothetical protein
LNALTFKHLLEANRQKCKQLSGSTGFSASGGNTSGRDKRPYQQAVEKQALGRQPRRAAFWKAQSA